MMLTAFPGRTQRQLKNKFKRENRTQSALVSLALDASIAVDVKAPMVIEAAPDLTEDGSRGYNHIRYYTPQFGTDGLNWRVWRLLKRID